MPVYKLQNLIPPALRPANASHKDAAFIDTSLQSKVVSENKNPRMDFCFRYHFFSIFSQRLLSSALLKNLQRSISGLKFTVSPSWKSVSGETRAMMFWPFDCRNR